MSPEPGRTDHTTMASDGSAARPMMAPIVSPHRHHVIVRWSGTGWAVEVSGVPAASAHVARLDQARHIIRSEIARAIDVPEEEVELSPYLTILPARPAAVGDEPA